MNPLFSFIISILIMSESETFKDYTLLSDMGLLHELYRRYRCQD